MTSAQRLWTGRVLRAVGILFAIFVLLLSWAYLTVSLPSRPKDAASTVVLDAKGGRLTELYKTQNRVDVRLDQVADLMQKAVVDAEDRHFFSHGGLDPVGTARALVNDAVGRKIQGGSTITQQLVKNAYLSSQRSIVRKFKEAVLAVKVEQRYTKREILQRYLNAVYWGRGVYGVELASQQYFGTDASKLTLEQSALLAGLIRAPETADPTTHPDEAKRRRGLVLDAMARAKTITKEQAEAAKSAPLGSRPRTDPKEQLSGPAAWFNAMVEQWAIDKFGEQRALTGGLRIETTLDAELEDAAGRAIASTLDKPDDPDAALVSMADDGAVVALVGGSKAFQQAQINLAVDRRRPQAGSTFKPFVLAAALDKGIPGGRTYPGPARLTVPFKGFPPFAVENFNNESFGPINLSDATAESVNTVYAQLAADTGLDNVANMAHQLGVQSKFDVVPAMALGSANVSPMDMLRAYMTFAGRGKRPEPYFVRRVTDGDGNELYKAQPRTDVVLDQKKADAVNSILQQVIARGTGTGATIGRPAAGKTGTTSNNTDAWFIGYTPNIGTAVWMGYRDDYSKRMDRVHGREVTGGSFPATIWRAFMTEATRGKDTGSFVPPDPSLLRSDSGGTGGSDSTATSSTDTSTTTSTSSTTPGSSTTTSSTSSTTSTSTTSTSTSTTSTTQKPRQQASE